MGGKTSDGDSTKELKTDEIFPSQACVQNICSIPDLAQGRPGHTLSILSSGLFVVCGGIGEEYSDPDFDYGYGYGYGYEGYSEGTNAPSNNSTNNASADSRTDTRSIKGPLDDCLVLTKFGTANASWVHHDTYMRFASL